MAKNSPATIDPWNQLRQVTQARIALGRAGGSLPTAEWLAFKSAHAAARDAVHNEFDAEAIAVEITAIGVEALVVNTAAPDRAIYLQRPDLGRRLNGPSRKQLQELSAHTPAEKLDLAIVVSDGLSALAAHRQAPGLLRLLVPTLLNERWRLAPVVVARFGRVALEDEIGEILQAELALILIGERPGLGSPDSLGAYLVYQPRAGNTDACRNCVSNIRAEGLPWTAAAETLHYLLTEARRQKISGVALKDNRALPSTTRNALAPSPDEVAPG